MTDKARPEDQSPDAPQNPASHRGVEWGRRPSQIFHVGPVVGGTRLYSGQPAAAPAPQGQVRAQPVPRPAPTAPRSQPQSSVLSGSLVPQRRAPAVQAEPKPAPAPAPALAPAPARASAAAPAPEPTPMASLEPAPVGPESLLVEPLVKGPQRDRSRRGLYGLALGGAALIGIVAVLLLTRPSGEPEVVATPTAPSATVTEPVIGPVVPAVQEPVAAAPVAVPRAREVAPVTPPRVRATAPVQSVAPEPKAEEALPPQIVVEAPPVGPPPTPARRQSDDPDAPIVTQPQPLDTPDLG